jgi:hypothetical protein
MVATEKQYNDDLKPSLLKMGKQDNTWGDWNDDTYITSSFKEKIGNYSKFIIKNDSLIIEDYNPELFLALAAMTDKEDGNLGEWWKFKGNGVYCGDNFTHDKLYKQIEPTIEITGAFEDNKGDSNGFYTTNSSNQECFIKATQEEIIAHFSKPVINDKKVCFKSDGTFETGAKIIAELEKLGGNNTGFCGNGTTLPYYFIDVHSNIDVHVAIPDGYTLKELPKENQIKVGVGDIVRVKPGSRWITCYSMENDWGWNSGAISFDKHFKGEYNREKQYVYKIDDNYVYIEYVDYLHDNYIIVDKENVELVKVETKIEKNTDMKNRTLTPKNALRIIEIACSAWKSKLAEKWSVNIVLNSNINISEEFYTEMRKACTTDQSKVFDEIFGKDEQLIKATDLEIGESMKIYDENPTHNGRIITRIWSDIEVEEYIFVDVNRPRSTWGGWVNFKGKKVKLTITHEEVK